MAFIKVLKKNELPAGMLRELQVEGKVIALANVDGTFYAIDNICLHRGGPLADGELTGNSVTCPWHGWQYDITTGKSLMNPAVGLKTFPVEVRGEDIYVDICQAGSELPS
ncbi:MAG TPA: Rieske (2Fe-2S) protein [Candidatus Acidoferrales bacterium]|nr:Rieske (2Fe-2S) protein [Candidatus Acidoferrales bacterium]